MFRRAYFAAFLSVFFVYQAIPLEAQNASRENVTELYSQYYCPLDRYESKWDGDLRVFEPGTTSKKFKEAVLDRIYFFRTLAGIDSRVEISEALTTEAQRLSHLMSANYQYQSLAGQAFADPETSALHQIENKKETIPFYFNSAHELIKKNYAVHGGDIGEGLVNLVRNEAKRHDVISKVYESRPPTELHKLLSPALSKVGIGTVEPAKIHGTYFGGETLKGIATGTLLFEESSAPIDEFAPTTWPPAGYVPYTMIGNTWSAKVPGADMRTAYVTVKQIKGEGDTRSEELVKIKTYDFDQDAPRDILHWEVVNNFIIGRRRNFSPEGNEVIHFEVTIGNISYKGSSRDITYDIYNYIPYSKLENIEIKLTLPPRVKGDRRDFVLYKIFTGDGCLLQTDGGLNNSRGVFMGLKYSTAPDGPYGPIKPVKATDSDNETSGNYKDGFYRFAFAERVPTPGSLGGVPNELAESETLQYSQTFGFRRMDEAFADAIDLIDLKDAYKDDKNFQGKDSTPSETLPDYESMSDAELQVTFSKLKRKKRRCRRRKRRGLCEISKCKTRCKDLRTKFRAVKKILRDRTPPVLTVGG